MFLFGILHQTTTSLNNSVYSVMLFLFGILHQTTTATKVRTAGHWLFLFGILHQTTTEKLDINRRLLLFLFGILHQTTTVMQSTRLVNRCFYLVFYIKPQRSTTRLFSIIVVSIWYSTSNHNLWPFWPHPSRVVSIWYSTSNHNGTEEILDLVELFLFGILHQTTTAP